MWGLSFVVDLDFYFYNPLFRTRVFHCFHIHALQYFIGAQIAVYNVSYYVRVSSCSFVGANHGVYHTYSVRSSFSIYFYSCRFFTAVGHVFLHSLFSSR
jgi:hypothetical protein